MPTENNHRTGSVLISFFLAPVFTIRMVFNEDYGLTSVLNKFLAAYIFIQIRLIEFRV